jgi:hypothetical protein
MLDYCVLSHIPMVWRHVKVVRQRTSRASSRHLVIQHLVSDTLYQETYIMLDKTFYFSSNLVFIFSLNWLCWELPVICWWVSSIFYGFWNKLKWKGPKSANFQNVNVFIFHSILMHFFFLQNIPVDFLYQLWFSS